MSLYHTFIEIVCNSTNECMLMIWTNIFLRVRLVSGPHLNCWQIGSWPLTKEHIGIKEGERVKFNEGCYTLCIPHVGLQCSKQSLQLHLLSLVHFIPHLTIQSTPVSQSLVDTNKPYPWQCRQDHVDIPVRASLQNRLPQHISPQITHSTRNSTFRISKNPETLT